MGNLKTDQKEVSGPDRVRRLRPGATGCMTGQMPDLRAGSRNDQALPACPA